MKRGGTTTTYSMEVCLQHGGIKKEAFDRGHVIIKVTFLLAVWT